MASQAVGQCTRAVIVAMLLACVMWPATGWGQEVVPPDERMGIVPQPDSRLHRDQPYAASGQPEKSADGKARADMESDRNAESDYEHPDEDKESEDRGGKPKRKPTTMQDALRRQLAVQGRAEQEQTMLQSEGLAIAEPRRERERIRLFSGKAVGEPHQIGNIKIYPTLTLQGLYTDNLYRAQGRKKSDYQATVTPRMRLEFPAGKHSLGASLYCNALRRSLNYPKQYDTNFNESYGGAVNAELNLPGRWKVRLGNNYNRVVADARSSSDTGHNYYTNTTTLGISYDFGERWRFDFDYSHLMRRMSEQAYVVDNLTTDSGRVRLYYRFLPKTSVFAGYSHSRSRRSSLEDRDSKTNTYSVGIKWDATEKLDGSVSVGYTKSTYKGRDSNDSFYYSLGVDYFPNLFGNRLTFRVSGERHIYETMAVDGDLRSGTSYIGTGLNFVAQYMLRRYWFLTARYHMFWSDYSGDSGGSKNRRDEFRALGIGLRYDATKWLTVFLEGVHSGSTSNISGLDYDENSVTLTLTMSL